MATSNSIILKFSILLIILFAFEAKETTSAFYHRVTVTIINALSAPPTPTSITVHCKSKDDDLGFHTLVFGGVYKFSFKPIFFPRTKNTLFFCSFTWPGNPFRHYLDIYDQKRDGCTDCSWQIMIDGGCQYNKRSGLYNRCYRWKSIILMDANNTSKSTEGKGVPEWDLAYPPSF
jgi:hypothetical protein